ncbi:transcriptional antiterminator/mannitol/fructose-specific phosphotransferase system IIA component (Ntr-type) [Virgibacillus litoralis]|uniref:Ascorbate-specific PTS system EIIA component n=2 Tax=Virgibacillus litoralis TaxID=578221 RepID=A0ABS4HCF3_9BACI|nr:transcriptional antiterminator/mannitol/fructose-specific phosphotransferase system IIA component (Ntr-type) [Virgibacillus litoralis]
MEMFTGDHNMLTDYYIPTESERVLLILFILLSQNDLSLFHFTNALEVSNVTVLNDMKKARTKIDIYGLTLNYSRTEGYQLSGLEWDKRNLLLDIIQETRDMYGGLSLIRDFTILHDEKLNRISVELEGIEEMLNIKFTDEKFEILIYCLGVIFERVKQGNIIEFDSQIEYEELSDTKEYKATERLLRYEGRLPRIERLYITLQVLSTNVFSGELLMEHEIPQLENALYKTLDKFETNAFINLDNKEDLVQKLILHFKPAYYRIKYDLSSYDKSIVKLEDAFLGLDQIVKFSLKPLENFMKNRIPDYERHYLTIFIGGHLLETKQIFTTRKKALVVCKNGVTVSKLLRNTLSKLFPEFYFYPTMSMREFNELGPIDAAVIFSPVPIKTEIDLFIINPLLTEADKWNLRQRVMKRIYGVDNDLFNSDKLIEIIGESSTINNKEKLKEDLQKYLLQQSNHQGEVKVGADNNPSLEDLITEETITVINQAEDWKEAIKIASIPLLRNQSITENYVKKMIDSHSYENPYMILGKQVAIPHAEPKNGVNSLGMSLLIVKDGVLFSQELKINLVVVIAAPDANQHVKAIYQLTNLSMDEGLLKNILENPTKKVIIDSLRKITNMAS